MNAGKKLANTVISIVLYVLSGLALVQVIRALMYSHQDVVSALDQGMIFSENAADIIFYYIESCSQMLFMACILFALGWIVSQNNGGSTSKWSYEDILKDFEEIDEAQEAKESGVEKEESETEADGDDNKSDIDKFVE